MYNTKDRLRGAKGKKVYTNRKRSYFGYANGNFCSLNCQNDWFQQYGDRCIDYIGRITVSPERPEESLSYWEIRTSLSQDVEREILNENNVDRYSTAYWNEYHRRVSIRLRDYFQGESNNNPSNQNLMEALANKI